VSVTHGTLETRPALRRLAWAGLAALLLALAADAWAGPVIQRYVNFSVSPSTLDLGSVPGPGNYDSPAALTVHVTANCVHGGIVASVTALQMAGGGTIGPERVFVRLPATGVYVPMTAAVAVTPTMNPGVFDVVLKFRLETTMADAAGDYTGTMTITLAPLP
jgi:hypothetical protein